MTAPFTPAAEHRLHAAIPAPSRGGDVVVVRQDDLADALAEVDRLRQQLLNQWGVRIPAGSS